MGTSLNQVMHVEMFSIHSKLIVSIIITKFSLELLFIDSTYKFKWDRIEAAENKELEME